MYRWTDGDAEINVNFQENCSLYKHAVVWYLCIHYSLFTTDNTQHYNILISIWKHLECQIFQTTEWMLQTSNLNWNIQII